MKVKIETHAAQGNIDAICIIRLIPESNDDMTRMEWIMGVGFTPVSIIRAGTTSEFNYALTFKENR